MAIPKVEAPGLTDLPPRNSQRAPNPAPAAHAPRPAVPPIGTGAAPAEAAPKKPDIVLAQNASLRFHLDPDTGKVVVSLIDPETGEVVRQVPSEEALHLAKSLGRVHGLLLDLKV